MSYQVLARKWRPKTFNDVVGQSHALNVLKNGLALGRVHHAYLFSGTRGVGKTSIARLLAKGLNCETGITAEPCGKCQNCLDIEEGRFIDLIEVDAASRTKVEDTREILDNIQYLPNKGRFKVYLIDEVHMLSKSSFNALLKTLEEPPEYVKFLLATTDPQKLPVTILSRCLQLHLKEIDVPTIQTQLEHILNEESLTFDSTATLQLAKAANGSMRDALSLTDQAIALGNGAVTHEAVASMLGLLDHKLPIKMVRALNLGDGAQLMNCLTAVAEQGGEWDTLLADTMNLLHQISLVQMIPNAVTQYQGDEDELKRLAQQMNPKDVQLFYQILLNGRKDLEFAPDKKLGVEMAFLRALAFIPSTSIQNEPLDEKKTAIKSPEIQSNKTATVPASTLNPSEPKKSATDETNHPQTSSVQSEQQVQMLNASELSQQQPAQQSSSQRQGTQDESSDTSDLSDLTQNILKAREALTQNESVKKKSLNKSPTSKVLGSAQQQTQAKTDTSKKLSSSASQVPLSTQDSVKPLASTKNDGMQENFNQETSSDDYANLLQSDDDDESVMTSEEYHWEFSEQFISKQSQTPTLTLSDIMQTEASPELLKKIVDRVSAKDEWSREVESIHIPPLLKQVALNGFIEKEGMHYRLNVRSSHKHLLKNRPADKKLMEIFSNHYGESVTFEVLENDDLTHPTPNELREKEYQLALNEAKELIKSDDKVKLICQFFNSSIDEESIRPV